MNTIHCQHLVGLVCILVGLIISAHNQTAAAQNESPVANFVVTPGTSGTTQTEFIFDASLSTTENTPLEALQVRWDFNNDGEFDTEFDTLKTTSHRFLFAASFDVTLQIMNADGLTDQSTQTIDVSFAPDPGEPLGTPQTPFEFPFSFSDVVFDPIRPHAYALSSVNNQLYQINLSSGLIENVFDFGLTPDHITITPDGSTLYLALQKKLHDGPFPGEEEGIDAFITIFDLQEVIKTNQFGINHDVNNMVATDDGHLFINTKFSFDNLISYRVNDWTEVSRSRDHNDGRIKLHPSQTKIYGVDRRGNIDRWTIENGIITEHWDTSYESRHNPYPEDLFISPLGNQLVTNTGEIYTTADDQEEDLLFVEDIFSYFTSQDAVFDSLRSAFFWFQRGRLAYGNTTNYQLIDDIFINGAVQFMGAYGDSLYVFIEKSRVAQLITVVNPMLGAEASTPPTASFSISPTSGLTTTEFIVDASTSTDDDTADEQLLIRWDWESDGLYDTEYSTEKTATPWFTIPGTYDITLEVRDKFGFSTKTTRTLDVEFGEEFGETNIEQVEPYQLPSIFQDVLFDSSRPYAYITSRSDKKIYFYNLQTGIVEKQFSFDFLTDALVQSEDGSKLYALLLTHWRTHTPGEGETYRGIIAEFDLDRQVKTNQFPLSVYPNKIAVSPDGYIYTSSDRTVWPYDPEISKFDITDGSFVELLEELPDSIHFGDSPEDIQLYNDLFIKGEPPHWIYKTFAVDTLNTTIFLTSGKNLLAYHTEQFFEITRLVTDGLGQHIGLHGDSVYVASIFVTGIGGDSWAIVESIPHPFLDGKNNTLPVADFSFSPSSGTTNTVFSFDASNSQDAESPSDSLEVRWDWEGDGKFDTEFSANKTAEHQYQFEGTKYITLQVRDELGVRDTLVQEINVSFGSLSGNPPDSSNTPFEIPYPIDDALFDHALEYVYLTSEENKKVYILNLETGLTENEFEFEFIPEAITMTPSGDLIYVAHWNGIEREDCDPAIFGVISAFDPETQTKVDEFQVEEDPSDIVVTDDGFLYITGDKGDTFCPVRMISYHIQSRQLTGEANHIQQGMQIKLHPNGQIIYGASHAGREEITRFNIKSDGTIYGWAFDSIHIGRDPINDNVFFTPTGEYLIDKSGRIFTINEDPINFAFTLRGLDFHARLGGGSQALEEVIFDTNRSLLYTVSSDSIRYYNYGDFSYIKATALQNEGRFAGADEDYLYVITRGEDIHYIEKVELMDLSTVANESSLDLPEKHDLYSSYPNPFNQSTTMKFGLSSHSQVSLKIFNLVGKEVTTLINSQLEAGYHTFTWTPSHVGSGIYFAQMTTEDGFTKTVKLIVIK